MLPKVVLTDRAHHDLAECCRWWAEHRSAASGERWYGTFTVRMEELATKAIAAHQYECIVLDA